MRSDALFCSKCGNAFESESTIIQDNMQGERKTIAVEVRTESKTPIFSIFGICCGVLGIFTLGFVFVPLGFLFTFFGLVRREYLPSVISAIINFVGVLTSPILVAALGLSFLLGIDNLPMPTEAAPPPRSQSPTGVATSVDTEPSRPAIVEEKNSDADNDGLKKSPSKTEEALSNSNHFSQDHSVKLQSLLAGHKENCPSISTCQVNDFTLYPEDIDGDDKPEFIVTHKGYCGSGGCTALLMAEGSDQSWQPLADVFGFISIDSTSTLGKKDIHFYRKVYRNEGGWYMEGKKFFWTGNKYISNDEWTEEKR